MASIKRIAVNLVKQSLAVANIEPATAKAIVRRPKSANGGFKVRRWPWPRRKHIGAEERRAAIRVLDRELKNGGAVVYGGVENKAYCDAFASYMGGGYALAVNSGTNAVYVALRTLDLAPGSEVIVPAISDPGGVMPVALMNCVPIAADTQPGSLNTSIDQIRSVLSDRTAAIVVTHIAGHPVDMDPILELARERGLAIVEDCAQSHGTKYKGRLAGTLGDIAAFSTMFGKQHCTGGQGGVVFTRNTMLFARARQITDRGKPYAVLGGSTNIVASLNFNQDEISLAIGRVQLSKLPAAIGKRREFALTVEKGIAHVEGVTFLSDPSYGESSFWFMLLRIDSQKLSCDSQQFAIALNAEGIEGVMGGYPFYPTEQPWYTDANFFCKQNEVATLHETHDIRLRAPLSNAHSANQHLVRVDVHESLGPAEAIDLIAAIEKVANKFREIPTRNVRL